MRGAGRRQLAPLLRGVRRRVPRAVSLSVCRRPRATVRCCRRAVPVGPQAGLSAFCCRVACVPFEHELRPTLVAVSPRSRTLCNWAFNRPRNTLRVAVMRRGDQISEADISRP